MNELHYRYWLGILIAIIIVLLTVNWGSNKALAELLSFGLALSSLVLAVIAIFQSLFSIAALNQVTGSIDQSASEVRTAVTDIRSATEGLLTRTQELPGALGNIASRFDALQDKLFSSKTSVLVEEKPKGEGAEGVTAGVLAHLTVGGAMALYVCVRAVEKGRRFDVDALLKDRAGARYIAGYITALWSLGAIDAEFVRSKFKINSLKDLDAKDILKSIEKNSTKIPAHTITEVDAYFDRDEEAEPDNKDT
jgi:hypothetical protein